MPDNKQAGSVERAFAILEFMGQSQRQWGISELGRKFQIPKSTTHSLMVTLENLGYVLRDDDRRKFSAAVRFYGVAASPMKRLVQTETALSPMNALVAETGLTAHLAVLDQGQAVYVQKVEGANAARFDTYIGKRTNLHCTAVGKVLLAYAPLDAQQELVSRVHLMRHTDHTIASGAALRLELQAVRRAGFAFDDQEEELEARCIALPVLNRLGQVTASLGLCGSLSQIRDDNAHALHQRVRQAAQTISGTRS